MKLGIDLYSIRSQGWTALEYLDYCAGLGVTVVHFSEIGFIGSLDSAHLLRVREHAGRLGVEVELGMLSICPTSHLFDASKGTAGEQLARMIVAARTVGSKIVRCVVGDSFDRSGGIPIEVHIENALRVLRNTRSRALDAEIMIAVENHSGDMQARELKELIEAAGKDFTGACLDSGNPLWALEDPHLTLETLAPYVLTSHVRDTAVWNTAEGAAVHWVPMGEGNVGIADYVRKYVELCPGKALSLEIIVRPKPRVFNYRDPAFWQAYENVPAKDFARFMVLVEKGTPYPVRPPLEGEAAVRQQREDLENSLRWTRKALGLTR